MKNQEDFYRFKLGKFECICINDGGFAKKNEIGRN